MRKILIGQFIFVLSILLMKSASALAAEEGLPADVDFSPTVVHKIKYPVSGKISWDISIAKYYGDRLLNTMGLQLEPSYHLSETSAIGLPLIYFKSGPVSGLDSSVVDESVPADPKLAIGIDYQWNPIYGKFLLGDSIYHFQAGLSFGALALQMQKFEGSTEVDDKSWHFGPTVGLHAQIRLSNDWNFGLFSKLLLHDAKGIGSETGSTKMGWLYGLMLSRYF